MLDDAVQIQARADVVRKFVKQCTVDNGFKQVLQASGRHLLSRAIEEHRMDNGKEGVRGEMVQALIDGGIELRPRTGVPAETPLMLAVMWENPDIVRRILDTEAGLASVNDVDEEGNTALIYAVERAVCYKSGELVYVIDLLRNAGADVNHMNEKTEETALEILVKKEGDRVAVQQLLDARTTVTERALLHAKRVRECLERETSRRELENRAGKRRRMEADPSIDDFHLAIVDEERLRERFENSKAVEELLNRVKSA